MKRERGNKLGSFLVWCFALAISFTFLEVFQFLGAVLKTGIDAATAGLNGRLETLILQNHVYDYVIEKDLLHLGFQALLWSVVVIWLINVIDLEVWLRSENSLARFMVTFAVIVVALELVSYLAYLVQFIVDAVIAGVSSRAQSVTLLNIISFKQWGNVDFFGRICEAYIITRLLFVIKRIVRWNRRRRKNKRFENAESQPTMPKMKSRTEVHSNKARRSELYNVSAEFERQNKKMQEKNLLLTAKDGDTEKKEE